MKFILNLAFSVHFGNNTQIRKLVETEIGSKELDHLGQRGLCWHLNFLNETDRTQKTTSNISPKLWKQIIKPGIECYCGKQHCTVLDTCYLLLKQLYPVNNINL